MDPAGWRWGPIFARAGHVLPLSWRGSDRPAPQLLPIFVPSFVALPEAFPPLVYFDFLALETFSARAEGKISFSCSVSAAMPDPTDSLAFSPLLNFTMCRFRSLKLAGWPEPKASAKRICRPASVSSFAICARSSFVGAFSATS